MKKDFMAAQMPTRLRSVWAMPSVDWSGVKHTDSGAVEMGSLGFGEEEPAQSSDLNPAEHLWGNLACWLWARASWPTSVFKLTIALLTDWAHTNSSFPWRMDLVIAANNVSQCCRLWFWNGNPISSYRCDCIHILLAILRVSPALG